MLSYLVGQDVQIFAMRLYQDPYFVYVSSEDQPVYLRRLALPFVSSLCDMYQNVTSWLIYIYLHSYIHFHGSTISIEAKFSDSTGPSQLLAPTSFLCLDKMQPFWLNGLFFSFLFSSSSNRLFSKEVFTFHLFRLCINLGVRQARGNVYERCIHLFVVL